MEERRKNLRTMMNSKLMMKRLDGGENNEVDIEITDVSKTGLGFKCKEPLIIGAVYESFLTIWTHEVIHAFLQIVRVELINSGFLYGAVFIGMPETDASRIEVYQTVNHITNE